MENNDMQAVLQREAEQLILGLTDEQLKKLMQDMMNENSNPWRTRP